MTKQLKNGKTIEIDPCDEHIVDTLNWTVASDGYVKAYKERSVDGNRVRWVRYLHREIMRPEDGMVVDHISGDRLDNRRSNLRNCGKSLNAFNSLKAKGRSKIRGVIWNKQQQKWQVVMTFLKKRYHFGFYSNLDDAAQVAQDKREELMNGYHLEAQPQL